MHWYRKNVLTEEIAEDSEIYNCQDYREHISDEQMAYSMTIRYDQAGWTVSLVSPSMRKGIGDVDNRYSMSAGSIEEAIAHIKKISGKRTKLAYLGSE